MAGQLFFDEDLEMDVLEDKTLRVVKGFTRLVDEHKDWSLCDLADDAVLDWFGRTIRGRYSILSFIRSQVPNSLHRVESVRKIPTLSHRLVKPNKVRRATRTMNKLPDQKTTLGDSDGRHTPDNPIRIDFEEIIKAPLHKMANKACHSEDWQFVEISGVLEYEHEFCDKTSELVKKHVKRIVLGYTDYIHFVLYEGDNSCRKKLLPLFNSGS